MENDHADVVPGFSLAETGDPKGSRYAELSPPEADGLPSFESWGLLTLCLIPFLLLCQ